MPETPEKALERLLHELFDADEFRIFLRGLEGGERLVRALAGKATSEETLFSEAVQVLKRRGEIDGGFFQALVEERPKKSMTITQVASTFGLSVPLKVVASTRPIGDRKKDRPAIHFLVVEDDDLHAEFLIEILLREFKGAQITHVTTERQFREWLGGPHDAAPDVAIIDLMLRWDDATAIFALRPQDVLDGGTAEAGIRCAMHLSERFTTSPVPVVLHSVFDRAEVMKIRGIASMQRTVIYVEKGSDSGRLIRTIRSLLAANQRIDPKPAIAFSDARSEVSTSLAGATSVQVFLTYSHDSPAHEQAVLDLANRLRADGIDAWIDQYVAAPPEGWPRWMTNQVEESKYILLVCTETFKRRFDGKEKPGTGKGATWEGLLANQVLYEAGTVNEKLIPVLLHGGTEDHIPLALKPYTHYRLPAGYDDLVRHLTGQPAVMAPPLGKVRAVPPVTRGPALAPQPVVSAGLPETAPPTAALQSLAEGLKTCSQESWWMRLSRLLDALRADPRIAVHLPAELAEPGDPDFLWEYRQARRDIAVHARQAYQAILYFSQDGIPARVAPDFRPHSHPLYQVQPRSQQTLHRWEGHRARLNECYVEPLIEWAGQLGGPGPLLSSPGDSTASGLGSQVVNNHGAVGKQVVVQGNAVFNFGKDDG